MGQSSDRDAHQRSRAMAIAMRTLRRRGTPVGETDDGEPVIQVAGALLVLPAGASQLYRLADCARCGRSFGARPVHNPRQLKDHIGPTLCAECVTIPPSPVPVDPPPDAVDPDPGTVADPEASAEPAFDAADEGLPAGLGDEIDRVVGRYASSMLAATDQHGQAMAAEMAAKHDAFAARVEESIVARLEAQQQALQELRKELELTRRQLAELAAAIERSAGRTQNV